MSRASSVKKRGALRKRSNPVWLIILLGSTLLVLVSMAASPVAAQSVTLTPNVGTGGTIVQINGFGFDSDTTTFSVTESSGGLLSADLPGGTSMTVCNSLGSGNCVGTFTISNVPAPAGIYVLAVRGEAGCSVSCGPAYAQFLVGAPSAQISLSPTIGGEATIVVLSGNGYSVADVACAISTGTSSIDTALFSAAPTCSMSVGNAGGSFVVKAAAPPGLYVITLLGCNAGGVNCALGGTAVTDLASAYFEVPSTTTTTTTLVATSIITSSTFTTTTTTTTTVLTTSTTSVSSTGIFTEQSSAFQLVTNFAASTATATSTSLTTFTETLATTILTSTTLFTTSVIGGGVVRPTLFAIISVIGLAVPLLLRRFPT